MRATSFTPTGRSIMELSERLDGAYGKYPVLGGKLVV